MRTSSWSRQPPPLVAGLALILMALFTTATATMELEFNADDTAALEMDLTGSAALRLVMNAADDFVIVALNDTAANLTVSIQSEVAIDGHQSAGLSFAVIKPDIVIPFCTGNLTSCDMIVTLTSAAAVPIKLRAFRGRLLQHDQTVFDVVAKTKTKRYAVELDDTLLPALITTRPNPSQLKMDVDMFVYAERDPFTYLFPNINYRNHRWNYAEEFTITESLPFWISGLYIIEVYASCDTAFDLNDYSVTVYSQVDNGLVLTLIGMAMALFLALAGVVFMLAVVHQHRRRVLRALRLQQLAVRRRSTAHPARAATKEQIDAIPIVDLAALNPDKDDAKCSICLCEYTGSDQLRKIACGHHFHNECLLEWLQKSVQCPLCQQDVSKAKDCRSPRDPSRSVETPTPITSGDDIQQTDRYQPLQEEIAE